MGLWVPIEHARPTPGMPGVLPTVKPRRTPYVDEKPLLGMMSPT